MPTQWPPFHEVQREANQIPRILCIASFVLVVALGGIAPAPASAKAPLEVVRATKPPAQVAVGGRVTIKVKIRNQSRRKDYVHAELQLQPTSPLPDSPAANRAYGSRSPAAGHGPRSILKPGETGKAKLVWKVPAVHRGFDGKLVVCATGRFRATAGQCRAVGPIRVSGSLLSVRAGVSATSSLTGTSASIGLATQELASDGRGEWWAGPERWTATATVGPGSSSCPVTLLGTRVIDKPRGTGLTVRVGNYGAAPTPSNLFAELRVPAVEVTSQTGGSCASPGDPPIVSELVHYKSFPLQPNSSGLAQFSETGGSGSDPELNGTLTVQP